MKKIDHIGIAVKDLEESIKIYKNLGLKVDHVEEVKDQKVKVAFFPIGESHIRLIQSTDPEGIIAQFIEKNGEGFHHIALLVENIENALENAKRAGLQLIDESPRIGAGGAKIAFLHPKSLKGLLLEFCQRSALVK
ncbi:MAG: methylmalonyl-CoA epimerase [Hadesarchaea archaeon DG-33-1]|nr:MAG: methylmalonyl-CoA epimerase [Hadesarchaea archaeon DG-33-1]